MTIVDYVGDQEIKEGLVLNGLRCRFVGRDVLYDYAAMNPSAAHLFDPKNICGIQEDEFLLNTEYGVSKEDTNHEINEDNILRTNPLTVKFMQQTVKFYKDNPECISYWEAHTALMALVKSFYQKNIPGELAVKNILNLSAAIKGLGV